MFVGFSAPKRKKLGSEAIKYYMGTPYSHVYLRLYSSYTGQWLVYQASHGMVHLVEWENFQKEATVIAEFKLDIEPANLRQTVKQAQKLLGRPYGYLGLLKIVLRRIFPALKGDGTASFHCSELIATLLPELALNKTLDYVEPVDLFVALTLNTAVERVV